MSRKSAYALRKRDRDFAALWDSALAALKASRLAGSANTALRQTEGDEGRRMVNHAIVQWQQKRVRPKNSRKRA